MEQKALKKEEVKALVRGAESLRDKALISVLYLTGARVSEIVGELKRSDILFNQEIKGKEYTLFTNIPTLKRREQRPLRRSVPANEEKEAFFLNVIKRYVRFIDREVLFPISRQRAWQLLKRAGVYAGRDLKNPLRHDRLTHLSTIERFSSLRLRQFTGRKTEPQEYSHMSVEDTVY